MSIVLALLAALAGVGTLLWRINAAADATKGLVETASDLSNLRRRWSWRRKSIVDPLLLVDDPRLAAVTLMMSIAQSDGALTAPERATIIRQAMEHFGCSSKIADEMVGYSRFLLAETRDPTNCFLKLKPLILKSCSTKERADLIVMLKTVSDADGSAADLERHTIDQWTRELA